MKRSAETRSMSIRRMFAALALAILAASLRAQEAKTLPRTLRESISLETSSVVAKQLEAARDDVANGQWTHAFDLLEEVSSTQEANIASLSTGRYASTSLYTSLLLSTLPAEGRAAYRGRVDAQALSWLETARREHDESRLWTIVDRAFNSSAGDDALNLLGEWSWERGDIDTARACWLKILPPTSPQTPGKIPAVLQYPDTDLDTAGIGARLVLCSLAQQNTERAAREIEIFRELFPDAAGRLAGKEGKLADILTSLLSNPGEWNLTIGHPDFPTFAFNAERNTLLREEFDAGAISWSQSLPSSTEQSETRVHIRKNDDSPACFPATYQDIVLVNTLEGIHAWNMTTGKPAWPESHDGSLLYRSTPEGDETVLFEPTAGTPQFTMSIDQGRLYARVGSPITEASKVDEMRGLAGRLVCLDLARGEGKLRWSAEAAGATEGCMFAGSPLVRDGRLYAVLHKGNLQTEISIACYDCDSGNLIWVRKVCAAAAADQQASRIEHQLLTWGERTLYLSTDAGAIAAIDARDGNVQWVVTYESQLSNDSGRASRAQIPCLYYQGLVVAAPRDYDAVIGIDASCGNVVWESRLRGDIDYLLGVDHESLVVSGDRLWGLDVFSGTVRWSVGSSDPATFGYGRGLLTGRLAYWPKRDEIFVVDVRDGQMERRIPLAELHQTGGGNLTMAHGMMFIARPNDIVGFSQYSRLPQSDSESAARAKP